MCGCKWIIGIGAIGTVAVVGYLTRNTWMAWFNGMHGKPAVVENGAPPIEGVSVTSKYTVIKNASKHFPAGIAFSIDQQTKKFIPAEIYHDLTFSLTGEQQDLSGIRIVETTINNYNGGHVWVVQKAIEKV